MVRTDRIKTSTVPCKKFLFARPFCWYGSDKWYPKGSCAFTRREISKRSGCGTEFHPIHSKTGTHTVAHLFGNGLDKNGTDKMSFSRRDVSDLFHFFRVL